MTKQIRIGADVGGTFTDVVIIDGAGRLWSHKVPSTPLDFSKAVLDGIEHLLGKAGVDGGEVGEVSHGTTVATNAVLEHRGARTALVTTRGFRDVLKEDVPNTAGMFKPLEIIAPPGTVLNGVMPAASSMRGITGFRLADTMFGALAGLLPDRILAAGEVGNSLVIIGGQNADRTPYVFFELLSGKAHLAIRSDRRDHLPYGLHGGKPGRGSVNIIRREDGEEVLPETARQEYGIAVDSSSHFALAKWLGIRVYEILRTSHPFSEFLRGRTTANPCDQIPQGTTLRYRRATDRKPRNPWSP